MVSEHEPMQQPQAEVAEHVREVAEQVRAYWEVGEVERIKEALDALHPADQRDVLVELPHELRPRFFEVVPVETIAKIVSEMHPEDAVEVVVRHLEPDGLGTVLDALPPDVAADVLHQMPRDRTRMVLDRMQSREPVVALLRYPDDTAGGLMTTEYAAVRSDGTAGNALDALRLLTEQGRELATVFTVDAEQKLAGQVSIRRLALARPTALVSDLMEPVSACVNEDADQEECARIRERYDLPELPVATPDGRLIGVIPSVALQHVVSQEATEDMFRMAGMTGERLFSPTRRSVRSRLPWLTVNLGTTFLAAGVVGLFESTIAQAVVLAAFLPVVAGQGGIGGTQTLTLIVRSIALGELAGRRAGRVLAREAMLGALHGIVLGVLVAVVAFVWRGNIVLSAVLGVAMLFNMLIAGFVGAGVPLLLRRLRQDPAVSSAVVVTTATDVMGFLLFLGMAALVIERLG